MNLAAILVGLASACALAHADELKFEDFGPPFKSKSVEIVWKLSTNRVPATMNIYEVIPAKFSLQTISNLIALGGFKEAEKARNALVPSLRGKDCLFEEVPAHRAITMSPRRGMASFFNDSRIPLPGQPEHGLPSDEQVLKLALDIAKFLGIKPSELATRHGSDEYLFWRDKRTRSGLVNGQYLKREVARGIYLYRAVDGISFDGNGNCGGLYVNFGNDAGISHLDLSWRNLEVKKSRLTASRDEITRRLRDGKAVIRIEEAEPAGIRKLTITDMIPHYRGFPSDEAQTLVHPFVTIEATADFGERSLPVSFLCPILKD